jgi:hypothetical protein
MTRISWTLIVAGAGLVAACGGGNGIPTAEIPNVIDTFTVASLDGGALQAPSAYSIISNNVVRTYETINFEFAYNQDAQGTNWFIPLAALGLSPGTSLKPGLLKSAKTFDELTKAEQNGYITTDSVQVAVGDVWMVRSTDICTDLGVPQYAKLEVDSVDAVAHTLTFQVLADNNCGYRGLKVGIPKE